MNAGEIRMGDPWMIDPGKMNERNAKRSARYIVPHMEPASRRPVLTGKGRG